MTQRAALYARVSTLQQEQEATIESQVAALEAFARQHGFHYSPDLYFLDQGVSGAQMDRPALNRLRDLAPEGAFDTVLDDGVKVNIAPLQAAGLLRQRKVV